MSNFDYIKYLAEGRIHENESINEHVSDDGDVSGWYWPIADQAMEELQKDSKYSGASLGAVGSGDGVTYITITVDFPSGAEEHFDVFFEDEDGWTIVTNIESTFVSEGKVNEDFTKKEWDIDWKLPEDNLFNVTKTSNAVDNRWHALQFLLKSKPKELQAFDDDDEHPALNMSYDELMRWYNTIEFEPVNESKQSKIVIKKSSLGKYDGATDLMNRAYRAFVDQYVKKHKDVKWTTLSDADYQINTIYKIPADDSKSHPRAAQFLIDKGYLDLIESVNEAVTPPYKLETGNVYLLPNGQILTITSGIDKGKRLEYTIFTPKTGETVEEWNHYKDMVSNPGKWKILHEPAKESVNEGSPGYSKFIFSLQTLIGDIAPNAWEDKSQIDSTSMKRIHNSLKKRYGSDYEAYNDLLKTQKGQFGNWYLKESVNEDEDWIKKGEDSGEIKSGGLHKALDIPKDIKIPAGLINKKLAQLKKKDKDKGKKGVQGLSKADLKLQRQLNLAKSFKKMDESVNENIESILSDVYVETEKDKYREGEDIITIYPDHRKDASYGPDRTSQWLKFEVNNGKYFFKSAFGFDRSLNFLRRSSAFHLPEPSSSSLAGMGVIHSPGIQVDMKEIKDQIHAIKHGLESEAKAQRDFYKDRTPD